MKTIKTILDRTLEILLSVLLVGMVAVALWAIFSRHILNAPASFTTEFLRYALLWLSLLAAAYVFGKKGHLAILFVKDKFKGKILMVVEVLTELIIIFFAATVLIYGGMQGYNLGMGESSPTLGIPVGYIYLVMPLSGLFIIVYSIMNLIDYFRDDKITEVEEPTTSTM